MDYEATLNQALDLLADEDERKATRLLQSIIDHLKGRLSGTRDDLAFHYYWGRALMAMDEPEQALLKFEKALELDPSHEGSLWETASIFLHDLDRPEAARLLLAEKLLPMNPGNDLYEESLKAAEFLIRVKKTPPPGTLGAPNDVEGKASPEAGSPSRQSGGLSGTPPGKGSRGRREQEDSEALSQAADALLQEQGDWTPEDEDPKT